MPISIAWKLFQAKYLYLQHTLTQRYVYKCRTALLKAIMIKPALTDIFELLLRCQMNPINIHISFVGPAIQNNVNHHERSQ